MVEIKIKYEYKILSVDELDDMVPFNDDLRLWTAGLNILGNNGWELCGIDTGNNFYFKRQVL